MLKLITETVVLPDDAVFVMHVGGMYVDSWRELISVAHQQ